MFGAEGGAVMTWREAFDLRAELVGRIGSLSGCEREDSQAKLMEARMLLTGCEYGWWQAVKQLGIEPGKDDPGRLERLCGEMEVSERIGGLLAWVETVYKAREASR